MLWHSGFMAQASSGASGNREAVWPSFPIPRITTSSGKVRSASSALTCSSPSVGVAPGCLSDKNRADAARFCNRLSLTRRVLLASSFSSTQRSSASTTSTLLQSSPLTERARKKGKGVEPPETTRLALGACFRRHIKNSATVSVRLKATSSEVSPDRSLTPSGRLRSDIFIPVPPVPGYHGNGGNRAPGSSGVSLGRLTAVCPVLDNLIHPAPGIFHFVPANKQVLVALHNLPKQTLVGIRNTFCIEGFRKGEFQRPLTQAHALVEPLVFGEDLQGHAFIWLQADNQLVVGQVLLVRIKYVVWRRLEVNDDLGKLLGQALAGADIKRHPGPPPVIDFSFQRHKGFGGTAFVGTFLFQIPGNRLANARAGRVLTTNHIVIHHIGRDLLQGLEHLYFLIANAVC